MVGATLWALVTSYLLFKIYVFEWDFSYLFELQKSPYIYGEDLCHHFQPSGIKLSLKDNLFSILMVVLSPKPVIELKLNNTLVILKKLASTNEFKKYDQYVASEIDISLGNLTILEGKIRDSFIEDITENEIPKLYLCQKQRSFSGFFNYIFDNHQTATASEYLNLLTILKLNPEPILLKILNASEWPVPKFIGSCGRIAAFEHCGESIANHISAPWFLRANISYQLLLAADKFTFKHPQYSFYFTDISPDNIAFDSMETVRFVDLENIIIVDRSLKNVKYEESDVHTSKNSDCNDCLSFSTNDICEKSISDHNIFGVCKTILFPNSILQQGLLHSPPLEVLDDFRYLERLIKECVETEQPNRRFDVSKEMQILLLKILKAA